MKEILIFTAKCIIATICVIYILSNYLPININLEHYIRGTTYINSTNRNY